MRVLMLGWEFPPFITGGLGTACHGLTRALDRRGVEVTFVLPRPVDRQHSLHVNLVSPRGFAPAEGRSMPREVRTLERRLQEVGVFSAPVASGEPSEIDAGAGSAGSVFKPMRILGMPDDLVSPYATSAESAPGATAGTSLCGPSWAPGLSFLRTLSASQAPGLETRTLEEIVNEAVPEAGWPQAVGFGGLGGGEYSGDLVGQSHRYALFCVAATSGLEFDVIHAHDWLTYPAGLAVARVTGKPLVVHVHSTEFDRSGLHVNQRVYDIERRGMHGAIRTIAVSQLTKNLCVNRYGMDPNRVEVVYNGVDLEPHEVGMEEIEGKDKIVLYFGRITMQKGPEFFIQAAKRVLDVYTDVKFVVAGSGDQAQRMIELAASLGIGHKVLFTGFLRGKDIQRVFALADLYVMPSVSEPFGIAPLEALGHDVPILISKTSGVSEVLTHALKVDFWDVDDMANKIVAVLRHPPLSRTLLHHGHFEIRRLTWDGAAERCEQIYRDAVAALR